MSKALQQVSPSLRSTVYAPPIILDMEKVFMVKEVMVGGPLHLRKGILWH